MSRCIVMVAAVLLGCGGAPAESTVATPPRASSGAEEGIDDGVEVRLGCTLITRAEIDRELARPLDDGAEAPSRESVRDAIVRRRVAIRLAHELGLDVGEADVDGAMAAVASSNALSIQELRDELARRGMDEGRYREGLADRIRTLRIGSRSMSNVDPSALDVTAAAELAITRRTEELEATRSFAGGLGCVERSP